MLLLMKNFKPYIFFDPFTLVYNVFRSYPPQALPLSRFTIYKQNTLFEGLGSWFWINPWKAFLSYLTQLGLGPTIFLNQVLKLIVDVLFSATNLFESPTNFIMELIQKSLEIPWDFSRWRNKYVLQNWWKQFKYSSTHSTNDQSCVQKTTVGSFSSKQCLWLQTLQSHQCYSVKKPDVMVQFCNPSTLDIEARELPRDPVSRKEEPGSSVTSCPHGHQNSWHLCHYKKLHINVKTKVPKV